MAFVFALSFSAFAQGSRQEQQNGQTIVSKKNMWKPSYQLSEEATTVMKRLQSFYVNPLELVDYPRPKRFCKSQRSHELAYGKWRINEENYKNEQTTDCFIDGVFFRKITVQGTSVSTEYYYDRKNNPVGWYFIAPNNGINIMENAETRVRRAECKTDSAYYFYLYEEDKDKLTVILPGYSYEYDGKAGKITERMEVNGYDMDLLSVTGVKDGRIMSAGWCFRDSTSTAKTFTAGKGGSFSYSLPELIQLRPNQVLSNKVKTVDDLNETYRIHQRAEAEYKRRQAQK